MIRYWDDNTYENEQQYMLSLKGDDYYHFTIPFIHYSYDEKGNCCEDEATMEVDFSWDDSLLGYTVSYSTDADDAENYWETTVKFIAKDMLSNYVSVETFAFL